MVVVLHWFILGLYILCNIYNTVICAITEEPSLQTPFYESFLSFYLLVTGIYILVVL